MKPTAALFAFSLLALAQSTDKPRFLAADVHASVKGQNPFMRPPSGRGERYDIKNATMVDLIALAYGVTAPRVLGGPNWLEMDRFDILAKQPPQTSPENQKLMLQSLLAERFKLVVKEENRPFPSYALTQGKKHQLKEADGQGDTGCSPVSAPSGPPTPGDGTLRLLLPGANGGAPQQISIVNGLIEFKCRNITMAAFADGLRGMIGANLGASPVLDQTGLPGKWNFDFRYTLGIIGPAATGQQIKISDAIEKLGLKLEERPIPTAVLIVQSVNQQPSANPPGTAEAFPRNAGALEFEVATIKPTPPETRNSSMFMQPGGRVVIEGLPLRFLINVAMNANNPFALGNNNAEIPGLPSWADSTRFNITAKAPMEGTAQLDPDTVGPMMLALLKDRFKLAYHMEERETSVYALRAAKPKMTKADPSARAWCKNPNQIPGSAPAPPGSQAIICQNVTMAQFIELTRGRTPGLDAPIVDATGLEGTWDFKLSFNPTMSMNLPLGARPLEPGQPGAQGPAASDPTAGISIFEAVDRQLGLKLVKEKRTGQVLVVDHVEQTPTEN